MRNKKGFSPPISPDLSLREALFGQLEQQIAELQRQRQAIIDSKRAGALVEVCNLVRQFSFTAKELGLDGATAPAQKPAKVKRPITFRDDVTGKVWNGTLNQQERKPQWILDYVKAGTIEQYRVQP